MTGWASLVVFKPDGRKVVVAHRGGESPRPSAGARAAQCLRAVARREQLQLAYRTWVADGRPTAGPSMTRLQLTANAHMLAQLCASL